MRLLRLTTRKPTADFESLYSDSIILQPNSKMALQSVSINSNDLVVEINTDNNEIPFMILIGSTFKPDYMPLRFSLTYARSNIKYDNIIIGGEILLSKFINFNGVKIEIKYRDKK